MGNSYRSGNSYDQCRSPPMRGSLLLPPNGNFLLTETLDFTYSNPENPQRRSKSPCANFFVWGGPALCQARLGRNWHRIARVRLAMAAIFARISPSLQFTASLGCHVGYCFEIGSPLTLYGSLFSFFIRRQQQSWKHAIRSGWVNFFHPVILFRWIICVRSLVSLQPRSLLIWMGKVRQRHTTAFLINRVIILTM